MYGFFFAVSVLLIIVGVVLSLIVPFVTGKRQLESGRIPANINIGYVLIILGALGYVICAVMRLSAAA